MKLEFVFDRGALGLEDIERTSAEIWAGLAFDEEARVALKRDGLALDGLRLTGPSPFTIGLSDDGSRVAVHAGEGAQAEALLDLWQVYFLHRILDRAAGRD